MDAGHNRVSVAKGVKSVSAAEQLRLTQLSSKAG